MLKLLLGVAIAFAIGFLGFSAYTGNLNQLGQTLYTTLDTTFRPVINAVQPTITMIQQTWSSIPQWLRTVIIGGIPLMFTMFFAWSKNRAMQKLEQTKLEANQQITQMATETSEVKAQLKGYQEIQKQSGSDLVQNVSSLTTRANNAEATLKTQAEQLTQWNERQRQWDLTRHNLEEEARILKSKVKSLQYELDVERGIIKPPVH